MSLTLREAIRLGRLDDFVRQEEARGVPTADAEDVFSTLDALIKAPRSKDQTSHSSSRDGSSGK